MPPSPTLAAYWQHRGDVAVLLGCLLLIAAVVCYRGSRAFLRQERTSGADTGIEATLPLRGRWLRLLLLPLLISAVLLLGLGSAACWFQGFADWREAARYRLR